MRQYAPGSQSQESEGPKPTGRLSDVVEFLFATGVRIGEAVAVRWDDIHFDGDRILVTVSGTLVEKDGLFYRQDYPKTDSQRILQLTQDWIQAMIRQRHRNKRPTRTNAVFATRNGTFVRPSNLRSDLKKAKTAAHISEKITPYLFRSTVSSEIAEHYRDEAAQQQLGHSSPETTAGITSTDRRLCATTQTDSRMSLLQRKETLSLTDRLSVFPVAAQDWSAPLGISAGVGVH